MKAGPKLYLCGLGNFPPYTTSLNVLHALIGCDAVVTIGANAGIRDILRDFGVGGGPHFPQGQGRAAAARALLELKRGMRVGLVSPDHPLPFGKSTETILTRCRKTGIDCEILGAVSPVDMMLARLNKTLGVDMHGLQAYDWRAIVRDGVVNARQPLVVVFTGGPLGPRGVVRLTRVLGRDYPRGHHCWMFGPRYEAAPEPFRLEEMAARFPRLGPAMFIHVPSL